MDFQKKIYIFSGSELQVNDYPALEAKSLYSSEQFIKNAQLAERMRINWLILSDMHGLVWPETMLAPYDKECMQEAEKSMRLKRALQPDIVANTVISALHLQCPRGLGISEWREKISQEYLFILIGEDDSISHALTHLLSNGFLARRLNNLNLNN